MRKTILLFTCLIGMLSLQAQTESEHQKEKKLTFGWRTGYEFQANSSNLNYSLNLPYVGTFSDFKLNDNWSLQLELNLRSEKRERHFNNGFKESIDELYLTVPVLLKYRFSENFKVYTGTQVLSASLVNDISGLKKWNGILGVEYHITEHLFLDARFRHGFENQKPNINFRDNRISIGIGYRF